MTREQSLIQGLTQSIKDITNAAGNDQPYSLEELENSFGADYAAGYEYLQENGIEEID